MNEKSIELINQISEKLGTSVETLVGWFVIRAPHEFVLPAIFFVFCVLGIGIIYLGLYVDRKSREEEDPSAKENLEVTAIITVFVGCAMSGISLICFSVYLYEAIMAVVSPEAYAVQEILRMVTG